MAASRRDGGGSGSDLGARFKQLMEAEAAAEAAEARREAEAAAAAALEARFRRWAAAFRRSRRRASNIWRDTPCPCGCGGRARVTVFHDRGSWGWSVARADGEVCFSPLRYGDAHEALAALWAALGQPEG
jgi:hypothetical protein